MQCEIKTNPTQFWSQYHQDRSTKGWNWVDSPGSHLIGFSQVVGMYQGQSGQLACKEVINKLLTMMDRKLLLDEAAGELCKNWESTKVHCTTRNLLSTGIPHCHGGIRTYSGKHQSLIRSCHGRHAIDDQWMCCGGNSVGWNCQIAVHKKTTDHRFDCFHKWWISHLSCAQWWISHLSCAWHSANSDYLIGFLVKNQLKKTCHMCTVFISLEWKTGS